MPAGLHTQNSHGYPIQVAWLLWYSFAKLVRASSHSRRAQARRQLARRSLLVTAFVGPAIVALMFGLDVVAIQIMPPRGSANLWLMRIMTEMAKSTYVLSVLAVLLICTVLILPRLRNKQRSVLIALSIRIQFLFFAVLVPVIVGEILKFVIGRGRPFVGGEANAFNYSCFAGTEAFASLPSGHAITAAALAYAVAAIWPRAMVLMWVYATLMCAVRVILLAHHPSDVVGGALIGIMGAMVVQYWFASRRLVFLIRANGAIASLVQSSPKGLKRVAPDALAP